MKHVKSNTSVIRINDINNTVSFDRLSIAVGIDERLSRRSKPIVDTENEAADESCSNMTATNSIKNTKQVLQVEGHELVLVKIAGHDMVDDKPCTVCAGTFTVLQMKLPNTSDTTHSISQPYIGDENGSKLWPGSPRLRKKGKQVGNV